MADIFDMGPPEKLKRKPGKLTWQQAVDEEQEQRYTKNPAFLNQAFGLYLKGLTLPKLADALKAEWPEVNLRTLQRIAKENAWETSRAGMLAIHTDAQKQAEGIIPECIHQLQKMRLQMEGRILDHKEIGAYRKLVEDLMYYTGQHPKLKKDAPLAISSDVEIKAILDAISEDEVVGPAWKRRRALIEKAYRQKLKAQEAASKKGKQGK